ncbi:MAG: ABC transporter permease, partial [Acutalibacteraceae bacterium]
SGCAAPSAEPSCREGEQMRLYGKYLAMLLKTQLSYKASFAMTVVGQFLVSFTAFLGVYFLYDRFHEVEGYSFAEVLLCFAVTLTAFSLAECFARGFDVFPRLIRTGALDRILLRPRSVVFQVLTSNMDFSRLGRLAQAFFMLAYAPPASGVADGRQNRRPTLMLLGERHFSALFVLYAGFSFFTIEGIEFMNILTDGAREFGKYPFSVYGEGVLKLLTYVVPLALFQYYPLLYILGRSADVRLLLLPLAGFVFFVPCYAFFRLGLRKYNHRLLNSRRPLPAASRFFMLPVRRSSWRTAASTFRRSFSRSTSIARAQKPAPDIGTDAVPVAPSASLMSVHDSWELLGGVNTAERVQPTSRSAGARWRNTRLRYGSGRSSSRSSSARNAPVAPSGLSFNPSGQ